MKINKHLFTDKNALRDLIQAYFNYIEGEYHLEKTPAKKTSEVEFVEQKVYDRDPENATIAGLALFLGFNSREEFDAYESIGKYASVIKRARLQVEAAYEKNLFSHTSGAIFALKSMGWNEKPDSAPATDKIRSIKVKIIETGPEPVASEKEVIL